MIQGLPPRRIAAGLLCCMPVATVETLASRTTLRLTPVPGFANNSAPSGEAFALQWRHVDFERGVVKVRGTLHRVRREERKGGAAAWKNHAPQDQGVDW